MNTITEKYFLFFCIILIGWFCLSCSENPTETDIPKDYYVNILFPSDNSEFTKTDKISFAAILFGDGDTVSVDSTKWTSDISGSIGDFFGINTYLKPGSHKISCNMFYNDNLYSAQINIKVNDVVNIDTILISSEFEIFEIPNSTILALKADNKNNIYIGTEYNGLYCKSFDGWKFYNVSDGLLSSGVQSVGVDKNNAVYTGHPYFDGMSKFENGQWEFINMDPSLGWDVHCIIFDSNNKMWIATHYGEVINYINESFVTYPNLNVDFHHPNEIKFDHNGILWGASTYASLKYDGFSWDSVFVHGKKIRGLNLAIDNDNSVWFGCYDGLYKITYNDTIIYNANNTNLPSNTIWAVEADSKNTLWIGTENGLAKYDQTNWEIIQIPEVEKQIRFIEIDSEENVWFANLSSFGVYKSK